MMSKETAPNAFSHHQSHTAPTHQHLISKAPTMNPAHLLIRKTQLAGCLN